ncbi:MAG: CRTAC1 family protein [Chloracidobacterium sp.]|nr:CRTAC1 family protein [Chloracidobacterium sp.]
MRNTKIEKFARQYGARAISVLIIFALWEFARLPELSAAERSRIASRFSFEASALPELPGGNAKSIRSVHPSLKHIAAWISSVGAAVALNDLDGDGFANDVCYVDVRKNQVVVTPAPGQGAGRYSPFKLSPKTLPYNDATMAPMGALPGDFNEDGLRDVLVYYWGRTPIVFFQRAVGEGPFSRDRFVERELIPQGATIERWYTNAATQADLDGDGHVDLIIGNYFPDGARILDERGAGVEHMQDSMSRAYNGGYNRILRWTGAERGAEPSARFEEQPGVLSEEIARGWTLGAGAADLDGDLLPEIYFANDFGPDRLLHNRSTPGHLSFELIEGRRTLTTPRSKVLGHDSYKGMGVDFGDVNGDGLFDIFVSNIAAEYALEESNFVFLNTGNLRLMSQGVAPFVDQSESMGVSRSGWGWEARLGDFDNDGVLELLQAAGFLKGSVNRWPELHEIAMGNDQLLRHTPSWHHFRPGDDIGGNVHNPFYVRSESGRYYDISPELGLNQRRTSRGIATADVDRDGLLDYAVANQWEDSWFYHNTSPRHGAYLGLDLRLPLDGQRVDETRSLTMEESRRSHTRPAIGATARVLLPGGRVLVAQVDGGNGHSGKRSPEIHLGLGQVPAGAPVEVELRWRDPQGRVRTETRGLLPGWHTLLLASRPDEPKRSTNQKEPQPEN